MRLLNGASIHPSSGAQTARRFEGCDGNKCEVSSSSHIPLEGRDGKAGNENSASCELAWIALISWNVLSAPFAVGIMQSHQIPSFSGAGFGFPIILFLLDAALLLQSLRILFSTVRNHSSCRVSWRFAGYFVAGLPAILHPVLVYGFGCTPGSAVWVLMLRAALVMDLPSRLRGLHHCAEQRGLYVHSTYARVMLTFFAMLLYSSFLSCIWFRLGCALEYVSGDGGGQPTCAAPAHAYSSPFPHATWVLEDVHRGALKLNSPLSRYARALHFVVQTLFTIGYGDVRPTNTSEACMALFIILNGSLFYAFLISSLTSLLSNRDATTKLHRAESNSVLNYFRSRGVASELLEQLQSYSEFIFSQGRGVADEAVLRALPRPLCDSIRKGFIEKLLNVPFFRGLHECYGDSSRPCLDYLLTSSRLRMFTPGTPLVSLGQRRRVLYVVLYGRIEIRMHGSRCALLSLGDGDSLGELTVLLDVGAAEFVATAAEFTCVLEISRKSLLRAIKVAPALTSAECTPEALQQVWHEIQPRLEALYPTEPLLASPTHPACTAITPPKCCSFSDKDLHNPDSSAALLWVVSIAMGGCLQAAVLAAEQFKDKCRRVQGNIGNKTKRKVMDMLEQLDSVIDWWIVLPDSPVRPLWAAMTVLCIVYYLCAVPMRICTSIQSCGRTESVHYCLSRVDASSVADYVPDLIVMLDVVLHMWCLALVQFDGTVRRVVTDSSEIRRHFLRTPRFLISALVLCPLDILAPATGWLLLFRLNKMMSYFMVQGCVEELTSFLHHHWHIMISSEALTVFYLSLNTIISSLWLSAGWVMVTGGSYGFEDAVFWLLTTMTTTGYGNIVPQNTEETVFVIFACVIGPCVCATIIANFVSLLQRDDTSAAAVSHGREVLLSFLNSFDNAEKNDNNDGNTDVNSRIASFLPSKVGQVLDDMSFVRPGIADGEETYRSYNINSSCVSPPNVGASHSTSTVRRLSLGAMKTFYSVASRIPLGGAHNKTASAERGASQPKSVTDVVNDYFDALDKNGYSCSESSTLAVRSDEDEDEGDVTTTDTFGIPEYFRNEMKFHLIGNIVMASGVFSDFGSLVVREIILNMELRYISKYNVIVSSNLSPQFFGLIKSGNVQVYSAQGRRTQRLTHGDYFGVSSLVSQSKNSDNKMCFRAIALGPCELWTLAPRRFAAVLSACGDQEEHVQELQNAAVQNFQRITDPLAPAVKVLSQMNNLRELDKWFISPQSHEYVLWSAFMATMALFNALAIPTRIAFGEQVGWNSSFFVDYFGDLCFFADIILSTWFVAFYDNDDLVRVRSRIRERYIASHTAWAHFIAALPFDILLIPLIRSSRSVFSAAQLLSMLRVNRLARLFDAQERFQLLEQKYFATTARLRNILRLLKLIFMVLFCSHFIGCTFFFIANYTHIHGSSDNWADAAGILRECSLGAAKGGSNCPSAPPLALIVRQYVDSLYWAAATIATVGYGDIVAVSHREKLYNIFIFLVGTSVYSMAISHLQDIVSQLNITSGTFALRCERINAFLARETASDRITADMKLMLEKSWKYCRGATADEIQRFAPTYLYGHIIEFCLRDAFGSIYFLKNCKRPFIKSITEKLKFGMYLSGSTLFYSGELASNLYIMTKGEIKLVGDADAAATEDSSSSSVSMRSDAAPVYGSLLASRAAGACSIGESEFFMRSYYSCNAKAATDLVCFRLSFEEFSEVLSNHELTDDFAVYHANNSTLLSKTSTNHAVTTFSANMKHAKMIKMMAPTMTESLKKEFVFMPQSLFCKIWYTIYCILLLYFAFSVPFFIAFGFKTNGVWRTAVTLDAISIVFFGVDVFLNLFYFAVEHHGKIVASPPQFRSLYMKEDFLWDLAAVFPLAWFGLFLSSRSYFAFFRVPYLIRLRSIRAVFGKLVAFIETKLGIRFPDTLTRILRAVSMVWYFGHVVCCLFYLIGRLEARDDHASWLEENNLLVGTPSMEAYVWGYLWSMYTITTVGYGNISVPSTTERIVAIGVMITGAILCDAGVAAVLGSVVDSRDRRSGAVKRQVDATRAFCLTFAQSISEALSSQALHYFQYLSHNLGDENEGCDVTLLPPPIWMSLKCEASFKALCKANISSYLNLGIGDAVLKHGCIYTIIRYFEAYLSYPGQVLDTDSGHLFVLRRGKILKSGGEGEFPDTPCYVEPRTAIFDSSRIGGEANRTRYRTPAHGFLRNQHLPSSVISGGLSAGQSHESDVPLSPPQQLRLYISKVIIEPYGDHSTLGKGSDLDISDYEEDTRGALNTSDSVDVPVNQVSRSFSPDRMSIAHASLRVSSGLETWCHDISGADWASGDGLAIDVCASMGLITTRNGTTLVNINLLLFFQPKDSVQSSRVSFTRRDFALSASPGDREVDVTLAQDPDPEERSAAKKTTLVRLKLQSTVDEEGADKFCATPAPSLTNSSRNWYRSETFSHLLFMSAESLQRICDAYRRTIPCSNDQQSISEC